MAVFPAEANLRAFDRARPDAEGRPQGDRCGLVAAVSVLVRLEKLAARMWFKVLVSLRSCATDLRGSLSIARVTPWHVADYLHASAPDHGIIAPAPEKGRWRMT